MKLLPLVIAVALENAVSSDYVNTNLTNKLLKNYNFRFRPVKKHNTQTKVQLHLFVSHIEKLDEVQQTLRLHGWLGAGWTDEYLTWDEKVENHTNWLTIKSWRIWRPDIALYNSAEGNKWNLNSWRFPAWVRSTGNVWLSSMFSFSVTCLFDFSRFPYDVQTCPIVLGDWIYDTSAVNLSSQWGNAASAELNWYSSEKENKKQHVAGWQLMGLTSKHMYWGPGGLTQDHPPEGSSLNLYWSVMEFWITLKRHRPYFGVADVLPTLVTSCLTLVSFCIDTESLSLTILLLNLLLQAIFGWELLQSLPPGNGTLPRIAILYGFNMGMTGVAYLLHVLFQYLSSEYPGLPVPGALVSLSSRLANLRPFQVQGLHFDPQRFLNDEEDQEELQEEAPSLSETLDQNIFILRRVLFFLYFFMYAVTILSTLA